MTPFGQKLRRMRAERGITQRDMAAALGVSNAYLSALEHGKRGRPTFELIQRIIQYFNVIWDEADELSRLAQVSHPRITIETGGLSPQATELANLLSANVHALREEEIEQMLRIVRRARREAERAAAGHGDASGDQG